jgi:hypothetical protein
MSPQRQRGLPFAARSYGVEADNNPRFKDHQRRLAFFERL